MPSTIEAIKYILGLLTPIAQAVVVISLFLAIVSKSARGKILEIISSRANLFAFVVALTATLGSLFYSEIAHYDPCKLCWLQRIFMYPQAILFGIALWKRSNIRAYSIALSGVGAVIAGYHYLLQRGIAPSLACSSVGYSVSCAKIFVMNFGYITIPLMAFTAFALIIITQAFGSGDKK